MAITTLPAFLATEIFRMARPREFDVDRVLRETVYLFWRKGYEATSLRDIETATRVGRMSLYNVFGDKEGLFQAALEKYVGSTKRLFGKLLSDGGLSDLEALICAYTKPSRSEPAGKWGCLMLNTIMAADGVNPKARATVEDFRRFAVAQIEAALRRANEMGEIYPQSDYRDMADFILTAMWGAKAAVRHAGNSTAAVPVGKMLSMMLRRSANHLDDIKLPDRLPQRP